MNEIETEICLAQKCLKFIEDVANYLIESKGYAIQNMNDVKQGIMRLKSGLVIPRQYLNYKILYDHYEVSLLQAYVALAKVIITYREIAITEFAFRTLQEIGITRADILFSNDVSQENKNKFRLLITVIDLLESKNRELYENGVKLFNEKKEDFTASQKKTISKLMRKSFDDELPIQIIKEARKSINDFSFGFNNQISLSPFLSGKSHLSKLFSHWSHLLHGSVFHIKSILDKSITPPQNLSDRTIALIFLTSGNIIYRLNKLIKNTAFKSTGEDLIIQIDSAWQGLRKRVMGRWPIQNNNN